MKKSLYLASVVCVMLVGKTVRAECSHPFFPTKVGTEWRYKDSDDNEQIIKVSKNEGKTVALEATFIDPENESKKLTSEFSATCDDTGFKLNIAEMFISAAPQGMGGLKAKFENTSGATLPPPDKMKVGESWEQSTTMVFGTEEMPAAMKATMKIKNKIVGKEKVKVAAGSFDAYKIEFTSETQMAMPGMPVPVNSPNNMTGKGELWVAKGVGVVKHTDETATGAGAGGNTTTELVKIKR